MADGKIDGLDDVVRRLATMPIKARLKVLPHAASAGAAIFRDAAKRLAPVEQPEGEEKPTHPPGFLRDSIHVRKNKHMKHGVTTSYSAATTKEAFWGYILEYGFRHTGGKWVQVSFMRPAFDANKERVLRGFVDDMAALVDDVGKL